MLRPTAWMLSWCVLLAAALCGCAAAPPLDPVGGLSLEPGRYLTGYHLAPGFAPQRAAYRLGDFTVAEAQETSAEQFLPVFTAALTQAFGANGLKFAAGPEACVVSGTIERIAVKGATLRFVRGRIAAELQVSGTITRGGEVLFAFRDRLTLDSPLSPGAPAPKETELLLQHICREFAQRFLTELLLHGLPSGDSG